MLAYGITYGMNRILSKLAAYKFLLAVFALSFLAHITLFNFPDQAVFDEIYFGTFVRSYTTNSHFFDIHPPLGKLLIAGTAKLGGINLPADLTVIGQQYDSTALFFLRFFPLLAGIFLPVVAALIALELTKSKTAALLTGLMIVFENALLTQSRFIFLDIPMLFFGTAALFVFLRQEYTTPTATRTKYILLVVSGLLLGASFCTKWTALAILFPFGLIALYSFWQTKSFKWFATKIIVVFAASLFVYIASFAAHFALLTKPGPGDAFFETAFLEKPFFEKFLSLNKEMYAANKRITDDHPYKSSWYAWPLDQKPIFYWNSSASEEHTQQIWLLGNPIVWFASLLSLIGGIVLLFAKVFTKKPRDISALLLFLLLIGWITSYAPFALINRPLFLYHYFFPLLFSILLASYIISWLIKKLIPSRYQFTAVLLFSGIIALSFLLISPMTYGLVFAPDGWYAQTILKLFL